MSEKLNLSEEQLEKGFQAALQRAREEGRRSGDGKDFKLSKEEADKFQKAFQKKEFRDMFSQYLEEISDPKHREEQEAYLRQVEAQGKTPKGSKLVRPTAGFCVKTKRKDEKGDGAKVFINVCHAEEAGKPSCDKKVDTKTKKKGLSWSLPHMLGPPHMEKDKKGVPCMTFEVCFHEETIRMSKSNERFRDMVARVSLDAVEAQMKKQMGASGADLELDRKYRVLRGVNSFGGKPRTMSIAVPTGGSPGSSSSPSAPMLIPTGQDEQKGSGGGDDGQTEENFGSGLKTGFLAGKKQQEKQPQKKSKAGIVELSEAEAAAVRAKTAQQQCKDEDKGPGLVAPRYTVVHRGIYDLADQMQGSDAKVLLEGQVRKRPKELVIRIELPQVVSMAKSKMELEVGEDRVDLLVPQKYALSLPLPYPVLPDDGSAKFVKEKRILKLTLPVKALSKDDIAEIKARLDMEAAARSGSNVLPPTHVEQASLVEELAAPTDVVANENLKATSALAKKFSEEKKANDLAKKETDAEEEEKIGAAWAAWGASKDSEERKREEQRTAALEKAAAAASAASVAESYVAEESERKSQTTEKEVKLVDNGTGFIPSSSWRGKQDGMVFKMGHKGLGYYKDTVTGSAQAGPKVTSIEASAIAEAKLQAKAEAKAKSSEIQCPPFTFTQKDDIAKISVKVENIDDATVRFFPLPNEIKVKFASKGSGTKYELWLEFDETNGEQALPLRCSYELRKGEMIVIIKKSSNTEWNAPVARKAGVTNSEDEKKTPPTTGATSVKPMSTVAAPRSKDIVFELD